MLIYIGFSFPSSLDEKMLIKLLLTVLFSNSFFCQCWFNFYPFFISTINYKIIWLYSNETPLFVLYVMSLWQSIKTPKSVHFCRLSVSLRITIHKITSKCDNRACLSQNRVFDPPGYLIMMRARPKSLEGQLKHFTNIRIMCKWYQHPSIPGWFLDKNTCLHKCKVDLDPRTCDLDLRSPQTFDEYQ